MPRCSFPGCEREYYAKGWCNLHWQRARKYGSPEDPPMVSADVEVRFWRRVRKGSPEECWPYGTGKSYGRLSLGGARGKQVGAHCYSYELHKGPIPPGQLVLHECDNSACVNPAHLTVGDQKRNIRDMVRRGRQGDYERARPDVKGEKNGHAKLTDEAVSFIRRNPQISSADLARRFGCSPRSVRAAREGRTWRHVT